MHKKPLTYLRKRLPGFSLIELALVLIVIGILAGAIFKGQDIVEAAKIQAVLNDINRIRTATALYHHTFGQWPGNDPQARARFGNDVHNGQGNSLISEGESAQFWVHLAKAEHLPETVALSSKLGGNFSVEGDLATRKNFLILSGPEKTGLLTPKQASSLKAKANDGGPSTGQIHVTEGTDAPPRSCINDEVFNLTTKAPVCILRVELQ
jgi:prepilin-type N-terminal cleavage/methylation domain-containing protein